MSNLECIKKPRHNLANKGLYNQSYGFSSSRSLHICPAYKRKLLVGVLPLQAAWFSMGSTLMSTVLLKTVNLYLEGFHLEVANRKLNESESHSVISKLCNYTVHGILQARILEWLASSLLQGIFPTQRSNPGLQHCRKIYQLSPRVSQMGSKKKGILLYRFLSVKYFA